MTVELDPARNFLWPSLQLSADEFWEVTESTAWLIDRKMSRGRYLELLRGALLTMNVDHAQARAGSCRPWGLQPSITNRQLARGPQPVRKSKATWSMGVRYAGQRVIHSAAVKRALIQRFMHLLRRKLPELALNAQGSRGP